MADGGVTESRLAQNAATRQAMKISNRPLVAKIIWAVVIAGALTGFIYQTTLLIQSYLEYPILTLTFPQNVTYQFPDVTLCFDQQIIKTKSMISPSVIMNGTNLNYFNDGFFTSTKQFWNAALFGNVNAVGVSGTDMEMRYTASEVSFWYYLASLPILPAPEDIMPVFLYNGVQASYRNFTMMFMGSRGFCFRFQPSMENRNLTLIGPNTGLVMLLRLDNILIGERNRNKFSQIDGLKIYIHPANTMANFNKLTEIIQANMHVQISTKVDQLDRIATPSQTCQPREMQQRCYLTRFNVTQCTGFINDITLCQNDYYQQELIETCGCYAHDWLFTSLQRDTLQPCYVTPTIALFNTNVYQNGTDGKFYVTSPYNNQVNISFDNLRVNESVKNYKCYYNYLTNQNNVQQQYSCDLLCLEQSLIVNSQRLVQKYTETSTDELILKTFPTILSEINAFKYDNSSMSSYYSDILNVTDINLVSYFYTSAGAIVEVYSGASLGTWSVQDYRYYFIVFVSDVGGDLGLWLGCCIVTLFKFIEFTPRIVAFIVVWREKRRRVGEL